MQSAISVLVKLQLLEHVRNSPPLEYILIEIYNQRAMIEIEQIGIDTTSLKAGSPVPSYPLMLIAMLYACSIVGEANCIISGLSFRGVK